jgi:hypothetical protein
VPPLLIASPSGSAPAVTDHVYGAFPPVAVKTCEYDAPTVPEAKVNGVIWSCFAWPMFVAADSRTARKPAVSFSHSIVLFPSPPARP